MHIFQSPFYYVEYGLAQLGAVQVWRNSLSDQAGALARYRYALSLGCTAKLPEFIRRGRRALRLRRGDTAPRHHLMLERIDQLELVAEG